MAISDGGAGIEDWLRTDFPRAEAVILDFWHAAQHLSEWVKALHPDDAAGAAVLAGLRAMAVGRTKAAREAHRKRPVYVENQAHRMDDPAYRRNGWVIGSGPVEAACQPVANQRRKATGARRSEAGADAVCHLRARCSAANSASGCLLDKARPHETYRHK